MQALADDNTMSQEAKLFVTSYWAGWSQPNTSALSYLPTVISDPINFYGKSMPLKSFMAVQAAFADRWPSRSYTLQPNSLVTSCNQQSSSCQITGIVNWITDSPARKAHSLGSANFQFGVLVKNSGGKDQFFIATETGSVISRTLTTGSSYVPPAQSANNQITPSSSNYSDEKTSGGPTLTANSSLAPSNQQGSPGLGPAQTSAVAEGQLPLSSGNWNATNDHGSYTDTETSGLEKLAFVLPVNSLHFQLELSGFQAPLLAGSTVNFQASFDDGKMMSFVGTSDGSIVLSKIADSDVAEWTHEMTAEHTMTISFSTIQESNGKSEPAWTIPLMGATATVTALADAMTQAGINDLPSPWNTKSNSPSSVASDDAGDDTPPINPPADSRADTTTTNPDQTATSQSVPQVGQENLAQFSNPDGMAYAKLGETTWTTTTTADEMTDKTETNVVSEQQNGSGVNAEVTGACKNNGVSFSAIITDSSGGTTINLAEESGQGDSASVSGKLRINSDKMIDIDFPQPEYSNQFEIAELLVDPLEQAMLDFTAPRLNFQAVWRILAQVDTDHGPILIKIPIYDPQIISLIKTCIGQNWNTTHLSSLDGLPQGNNGSFGMTFTPSSLGGAEIASVQPYSIADEAGLRPGDVIRDMVTLLLGPTATPDEFFAQVNAIQQQGIEEARFDVLRQGKDEFAVIPVSNPN